MIPTQIESLVSRVLAAVPLSAALTTTLENRKAWFLPQASTPSGQGAESEAPSEVVEIEPGETILAAGLRAGMPLAHRCRVGSCGTCRCQVISGRVRELTDSDYVLTPAEKAAGTVLACQSVPHPASDAPLTIAYKPSRPRR